MGGIEEDMFEYIKEYFQAKNTEFSKKERDLIAVTLKKIVAKDRRSIQLLDHLVDQPRLKKYEQNMRNYVEKLRESTKLRLVELVTLLQTYCLPLVVNAESKAFFLNLIGDF